MSNVKMLAACLVFLASLASTAEAKLYKWVDDKGVTHYDETVPPEYAGKDNVLFDDKGRIIKKNSQLSADEKRVLEEAASKKRSADEAAAEQRRRDKSLLNTYSNEKEIDLARDRNLQQVEALINSIQLLQKSAQENMASYQLESQQLTQAGKKIPPSLKSDISDAEKRAAKLQQRLDKAQEKMASIRANFEADKVRYRELTGTSAKQ